MSSPIDLSSLLSAFGLGGASNIDVGSIVSQLMSVDEQPLTDLQNEVTDYQTQISAYGALMSSVSSLNADVQALQGTTTGLSATSSDTSSFTATASSTATAGSTSVDVENIASAQSLYSTAFGSETSAVADLSENPTQYLQIQSGSNTGTITINSSNNTLSGIASAINNANIGVTASVIQQSSDFAIGSSNDTINFSYGGSTYTATIAQNDYSGSGLASAITSAMNKAVDPTGSTTPFSVTYTAGNAFSITNTSATNSAAINWAGSTLTPQQLGFTPDAGTDNYSSSAQSPTSAIAANATITSSSVTGMYALSLTANSTGAANGIVIKADESGNDFNTSSGYIGEKGSNTDMFGLSALASDATFSATTNDGTTTYSVASGYSNLTQTSAAADAKLTVAGVPVTSSSNTITTAVPGVTLNLLAAGSGNLTVSLDSSSLATSLTSLVTAYNSAMSAINTLYNPSTNSSTSSQDQGLLNGDAELLTLQQALTSIVSTPYGTSDDPTNNYLSSIGITTDKNGTMSFDSSVLSSAYTSSNAANITAMIDNFSTQLGNTLSYAVNTGIPQETNDLQTDITNDQTQESSMEEQLNYEQTALTTEYTNLANLVAQDSSTSSYLTQETDIMTKNASGS